MEIKYTNFDIDPKLCSPHEIVALIDQADTFLYENIYDLRTFSPKSRLPVGIFLRFGTNVKTRKIIFDMLSEFEISKELQNRTLNKLSSSELIKILIIKICTSKAKCIVLESLDTYFNYKDMIQIIKTLKNHLAAIDKSVILTMNKVDNLIQYADRYVTVSEGKIDYSGKDFTKISEPTEVKKFTDLANAKGAKLLDYKEPNDLLKAIYRSVKKK